MAPLGRMDGGIVPINDKYADSISTKHQREFFLRYFLRNNVEADILRVIFFAMARNEKVNFRDLHKYSAFKYLSSNLLKKLRDNRFIVFDGSYDRPTFDGIISCLYILGSILKHFHENSYSAKEISTKLLEEGFSFAGLSGDSVAHDKVIGAFLNDLASVGFLTYNGSVYTLASSENLMKLFCEIVRVMVDEGYVDNKTTLEAIVEVIKESFSLDSFSLGLLIKESEPDARQKITVTIGKSSLAEQSIMPLVKKQAVSSMEKDNLASAAYWQLAAMLHNESGEDKQAEQCIARGCISLAIFCKRNGNHKGAAQFYGKAADIMAKYPEYAKNATLQLANALSSKGRYLTKEGNFQESSTYYLKAAELFEKLGNKKEATFCRFMNLKSQAREQASYGEYLVASKLMQDAANLIKQYSENHYFDCMAHASLLEKDHAYSINSLDEAAKACKEAAQFFQKTQNQKLYFRSLGSAAQFEGMDLEKKRASYKEAAEKFRLASQYYDQSLDLEASANNYADSMKNFGLEAKGQGKFQQAIEFFAEGKRVLRELTYSSDDPEVAQTYRNGETWFEAMLVETSANQKLLDSIPQKKKLDDVARLLVHSADLFTRVGDYKHANINSTFTIVAMAIDAFHEHEYSKATELIQEAKSRLPPDFAFVIFEDEVKPGWEPLRYALDTMGIFDKYSRQIETEKGFSFESRMRELFGKMYPEFPKIESIVFKPEEQEVGIVFKDNIPIEIDAFASYVRESNMQLLVAEVKNISKPVGANEMNKFLKKIDFVTQRYSTIARLSSLGKALIAHKLFVSSSGFDSSAVSIAQKNNIQIFDKEAVKVLLKKYSLYTIP